MTQATGVRPVRTMRSEDARGITKATWTQRVVAALCCLGLFIGAGLLAWVWGAPQYEAWVASNQFGEAVSMEANLNDPDRLAAIEQAEAYNAQMSGTLTLPISGGIKDYDHQLNTGSDGIMSWLEIPAIDVKLPVYHGDSDETLKRGLGHLDYTSLPVGGKPSHCVVTGHSGMPGNYMFDDLEQLKIGDLFVLWTLNEPFAYKVYDIEVVKPNDDSSLGITAGEDLATLITCTPYRINTHRLLVHAERVPYDPDALAAARRNRPLHIDRLLALLAAILAALLIPLIWALMTYGVISWGTRDAILITFGLFKHVKLEVYELTATGRRWRDSQGSIFVEFTDGDLSSCMAELGRLDMATNTTFEAVGDRETLTLRNLENGAELTFVNGTLSGVRLEDLHLEDMF